MKVRHGISYSVNDGRKEKSKCGSWIIRYLALFFWCIIILGQYITYDIPGSLQNLIMKNYNLNTYTFSYLYSAYACPNIFLCFLGGFLIDRIGVKLGLIVFMTIATLGQLIFVIGAYKDLFVMMLVGRLIFGSGCESSLVAMNNYAIIWFTGKELNMVFAIIMNVGKIGSSLVYLASEPTYHALLNGYTENRALKNTIVIMGSSLLLGFLCSILTAILNPNKEKKEVKFQDNIKKDMIPIKEAHFFDFISFPLIFWLYTIIISLYIAVIYSFFTQAQTSLTEKFHVSDSEANNYVFFSSFLGAILSTCFGFLIDYKGRNMIYAVLSLFSCTIGLTLLAFTYLNPYMSMLFMAVSVAAFFCSVWSPISYIIPQHQLGTAYGIVQGGMNLMFSIATLADGAIADRFGFQIMNTFLIICTLGTIPLLIWCWVLDVRGNKVLNMSSKERENFLNSWYLNQIWYTYFHLPGKNTGIVPSPNTHSFPRWWLFMCYCYDEFRLIPYLSLYPGNRYIWNHEFYYRACVNDIYLHYERIFLSSLLI